MKNPLVLLLAALVVAALTYALWPGDEGSEPPSPDGLPTTPAQDGPGPLEGGRAADSGSGPGRTVRRASTETEPTDLRDPSVIAALCGFPGRVVLSSGEPVANSEVKLYRGAGDIAFPTTFDIRDLSRTSRVDLVAGSDRTDEKGEFVIPGSYPQGLFALLADANGDRPSFQLIERAPGPGELVDLGDIELADLAVLTGRVVDRDGNPVAEADVWALDLPAVVAAGSAAVPFQRLDPDGFLITDEGIENVWSAPAWAIDLIEELPFPLTETDSEGRFRLPGVHKGSNVFVVRADGLEPYLQSALIVQSDEKDLGDIRLDEGEIAGGIVQDSDGEPIAGAEVVVAQKSEGAPVHFASPAPRTGEDGRFEVGGFPSRKVIAAARRRSDDPWTISEPVQVVDDLVIVLASERTLTVTVQDAAEEPIEGVEFQLLNGHGEEAIQTALWGLSRPVSLENRTERDEDGRYRLRDLPSGRYTMIATAEGYATGFKEFDLAETSELVFQLGSPMILEIVVLDPNGEPARGTTVFAQADGEPAFPEDAPVRAGTVDAEGRLAIDKLSGQSLKLSAQHPAYGMVHGEFRFDQPGPHTLQFAQPGRVEGFVFDGPQPPPIGKYTIAVNFDGYDREAALFETPRLVTHGEDGSFRVEGLRPGTYEATVLDSLSAFRSIGDVSTSMGMRFMMMSDSMRQEFEVVAGGTTELRIDTMAGPEIDGPTVNVSGFARINGRPAAGARIFVSGERRTIVEVDAAGAFDLGRVPVGSVYLNLLDAESTNEFGFGNGLWSESVETVEGEDVYLQIDIDTAPIGGIVFGTDGAPAANAAVQLSGTEMDELGQSIDSFFFFSSTDSNGRFELPRARPGVYQITCEEDGGRAVLRAEVPAVVGNTNLRLQMQSTVTVEGTVDFSDWGEDRPGWAGVQLNREVPGEAGDFPDAGLTVSSGRVDDDGSFTIDNIVPGTYRIEMWSNAGSPDLDHVPLLVVGNDGVRGLVIRPRRATPTEVRAVRGPGVIR